MFSSMCDKFLILHCDDIIHHGFLRIYILITFGALHKNLQNRDKTCGKKNRSWFEIVYHDFYPTEATCCQCIFSHNSLEKNSYIPS